MAIAIAALRTALALPSGLGERKGRIMAHLGPCERFDFPVPFFSTLLFNPSFLG